MTYIEFRKEIETAVRALDEAEGFYTMLVSLYAESIEKVFQFKEVNNTLNKILNTTLAEERLERREIRREVEEIKKAMKVQYGRNKI